MSNLLVVVVGMPGSGKSFAGKVLEKRFNAKVVEAGDIIREEIKKRGLKYTPENDKRFREWFHSGREHLVVKRLLRKLKKASGMKVIVGFRCLKELWILKRVFKGKVLVIAVVSSFKVRSQREMERKRFGKSESLHYIRERDKEESRIGLERLIAAADIKINNSKLSRKQMGSRLVRMVGARIKQI